MADRPLRISPPGEFTTVRCSIASVPSYCSVLGVRFSPQTMQTHIHLISGRSHSILRLLKQHVRALALTAFVAVSATQAHAQGCVTAHGSGLPSSMNEGDGTQPWDLSVSYRWYQSDRHYVGTAYQPQRDAAGDQVINRSNFVDLGLNYTISPRYSISLTVPYVSHDRSQTLKDANGVVFERYHTQATGLSDISVIANAWVFDPTTSPKGNFQVNFGFVLPTGKDDVMDTFESFDKASGKVFATQKYVDNSIQPGLGGYGINVGLNGYRSLGAGFTAYGSANYTITPQEVNRIGNSIGDSYVGRTGVEYAFGGTSGVALSLGLRAEGVAVYDLIGGSLGSRRPGYSVAVEPGISIDRKKWSLRFYVPYAIQRDRLQSYPDKLKTWATGKYTQGDAAFANYLIIWSFNYKL